MTLTGNFVTILKNENRVGNSRLGTFRLTFPREPIEPHSHAFKRFPKLDNICVNRLPSIQILWSYCKTRRHSARIFVQSNEILIKIDGMNVHLTD